MFFPDKAVIDQETLVNVDEEGILSTSPIVEFEVTNGRKIQTKLVSIPTKKLRLNPDNPRIRSQSKDLTQQEIEELLWHGEGTRNLYNEIKYSGGLSEKPIVNSSMVVLEGNRRTVCLRRLDAEVKNEELLGFDEDTFSNVQCIMLPKDIDVKDQNLLLARTHVSGKKRWSPLAQAEQVYTMINKYGMSDKEIANALSLSPRMVELMLQSFTTTMEYGNLFLEKDEKWIHKFSYFYELFRSRRLAKWASLKRNQKLFMKMLAGENPKLYRGSQVRELPRLTEDTEAMLVLRKKGFDEAIRKLEAKRPKQSELASALADASSLIRKLSLDPELMKDHEILSGLERISRMAASVLQRLQSSADT